jgi:plastocyanin
MRQLPPRREYYGGNMRPLAFPAIALAALLALGACSSGSSAAPGAASAAAPSTAGSAGAAAAAVAIKDFAFSPGTIQAKVGQSITWTNQDSTAHTVTLDDKSVDSGNIGANATYSHAFTQAGSFSYHCAIHPQMKGTVTVSG